jgi:integrase
VQQDKTNSVPLLDGQSPIGDIKHKLFCDSQGGPLRKSNVIRRAWKPLRAAAGIPPVRFHDLRHTSATLLLAENVHPKVVQEWLGHSKISLTMDTYSHVLPSLQRDAARKLDGLLDAESA